MLESLDDLSGARVPPVCAGVTEYFRDVVDHLQRLNQTIESIRDTVSTAISVNLSMITLQESETMKRLAAYAALVAIPTMIAGIYGMNFTFMPELRVEIRIRGGTRLDGGARRLRLLPVAQSQVALSTRLASAEPRELRAHRHEISAAGRLAVRLRRR